MLRHERHTALGAPSCPFRGTAHCQTPTKPVRQSPDEQRSLSHPRRTSIDPAISMCAQRIVGSSAPSAGSTPSTNDLRNKAAVQHPARFPPVYRVWAVSAMRMYIAVTMKAEDVRCRGRRWSCRSASRTPRRGASARNGRARGDLPCGAHSRASPSSTELWRSAPLKNV